MQSWINVRYVPYPLSNNKRITKLLVTNNIPSTTEILQQHSNSKAAAHYATNGFDGPMFLNIICSELPS